MGPIDGDGQEGACRPAEEVEVRIVSVRGAGVLLDTTLARLYGVTPGALIQAVRRNPKRFPADFLFQLTNQELDDLKSQSVISSLPPAHGGRRHRIWAFTEQGVAMLSSVLRSDRAIRVNIEITRAFVRMRRAAVVSREVLKLIEDLSTRVDAHDGAIADIVAAIHQLVNAPATGEPRPIGFTADISRKD